MAVAYVDEQFRQNQGRERNQEAGVGLKIEKEWHPDAVTHRVPASAGQDQKRVPGNQHERQDAAVEDSIASPVRCARRKSS